MSDVQNNNATITLYPSNWLYNAGVVGFLSCLDTKDYLNNGNNSKKYQISSDGKVLIYKNIFSEINVNDNYFENGKVINLKGKNLYYPNFIDVQGNQKAVFKAFVQAFADNQKHSKTDCPLCKDGLLVNDQNMDNNIDPDQKAKFFNKINELNMAHNKLLGPSEKFPNSYWNLNAGLKICHLCTFLLIHHHLALTRLADGSEIFINAPSFKVMYELNTLVKEIFGKGKEGSKQKREILAMSIIEYARRLQTALGLWSAMNIEIVTKQNNIVDFYSLPYNVVNIISDRYIASLLSEIGEFFILSAVLDEKYQELLDFAQKLIKISIKDERNKADNDFIIGHLKQEKNRINLSSTSQKILKLYATIIDRRKLYAGSAK